MKRPSIFIYQFHAAALFEPRVYICIVHPLRVSPFSLVPSSISTFLALEPRGVASLERALTPPLGTLFGYVKCHLVSNIFWEYRNHDVWLGEPLGMATIIDFRALAYGAERGSPLQEAEALLINLQDSKSAGPDHSADCAGVADESS